MVDEQPQAPSPLVEAKIDSIDELFRRDPAEMTEADIDAIIAEMRRHAALFAQSEAAGKPARAPKAAKVAAAEVNAQATAGVTASDFDV